MRLVLNDWGCFLGRAGNCFVVKRKEGEEEYSAEQVEQILILASSSVSSDAVLLAAEKAIDIVYLDWRGHPAARVYPGKLGGTTLTRRRQVEAYGEPVSGEIVRQLIYGKVANQAYFLKSLAKTRNCKEIKETGDSLLAVAKGIGGIKGEADSLRQQLLGIEGSSATKYFEALTRILPFAGRDQKGGDPVNACLNYGYGILYSEVEKDLVLAGLDPYFGYLHTDRYGKKSMVYDFIEPFRPIFVDRAIVTLFVQKQIDECDLEAKDAELGPVQRLKTGGRKKVAQAVLGRFHAKIKLDEEMELADVMLKQARQLAGTILDPSKRFEAFVYKW
jgi:CRISPR-associated protein Cas1